MNEARLDAYRAVPIAVLGGSGFIGRAVIAALCDVGASVTAIVRDERAAASVLGALAPVVRFVLGDSRRPDDLLRSLRRIRPAVTFNLAGYGVRRHQQDALLAEALNAAFPEALCRGVSSYASGSWPGQALVHVGSAAEYGKSRGDLHEETRPEPMTVYGRTKLAGTLAVARCAERDGVPAITARLFTVYGPGEPPGRLLPSLIAAARSGAALELTAGHQERDFTYVADVAEGLLRVALTRAAPGTVVNLATGRLLSVRAFADTAARIIGLRDGQLQFGRLPSRPDEMDHLPVRIDRLRELTDWVPPTYPADGIRRTVASEMQP